MESKPMTHLKIALLQMASCGNDQQANLAKGDAFCWQAKALDADIALFPEMWNMGYTGIEGTNEDRDYDINEPQYEEARTTWQGQAISRDDPFILHFRALARELEMAIAITYMEKWPVAPRNTMSLIDRHGEIVLTYAKVHTCDFGMEGALTDGDSFHVCALDTAQGAVNVGAMICYDREFPESARVLMLKGAEIILTPNACDLELNRLTQYRTRAMENMVGMAMTNYAAPQNNGHSIAFDGVAFDKGGSRDMLIVEAGEQEGVYLAPFDLAKLREYRNREAWGNSFRKPRTYDALTSLDVQPPFVRSMSRR
jgi:N-carbamoylputrescine amidase